MDISNQTYEQIDRTPVVIDDGFGYSDHMGELFEALAKAQGAMQDAKTDSKNPFFKSNYADLSSIVKAAKKPLSENGLSVVQIIRLLNGKRHLLTRLGHASGQWIDSVVPITPPKEDIQSLGSYITYLRRYSYAAIVGVVSSGEDDDGEKAMSRKTVDRMKDFEKNKI